MFTVYDIDGNIENVSYAVDAQELVRTNPRWIGFHKSDERNTEKFNKLNGIIPSVKERDNNESVEDIIKKLEKRGIKLIGTVNDQHKTVSLVCSKCMYKFTTNIGKYNITCPRCNGKTDKIFKVEPSNKFVELKSIENRKIERLKFKDVKCQDSVFELCENNIISDVKLRKKHDFLTIVATAETVKDDVKKWGLHGDLMAVNDAAFYLPNYQHAVSIHGNILPLIRLYKKEFREYEDNQFITHTSHYADVGLLFDGQINADVIWKIRPIYRSSGMLAIYIGIAMGYKSILVHGVTLDERNHYYDLVDSKVKKNFNRLNNLALNGGAIDVIKKWDVRVSSGRFSEQIGKPSEEWISQRI